jgi:hypothetical protein
MADLTDLSMSPVSRPVGCVLGENELGSQLE